MSDTKKLLESIQSNLKESDEVPYCDDVNCEPVKESNTDFDQDFYEYVKDLLEMGAIDDPDYYDSLSDEEKEDLIINTWMQDPEIIEDYKANELEDDEDYKANELEDDEDYKANELEDDEDLEESEKLNEDESEESEKLNEDESEETKEEDEPEHEEPVNDFERLSPETQEILDEMSSSNSMYKWVIDDVMDSDISGYNGDTFDEKLKSRLEEITEHGCQSGTVGSLIYYTDTVKFFDNFNDEIYDMIEDYYGAESVLDMLKQHCELVDIVMGADTVKNYLAWMAYEVTCSNILDSMEST